MKQIIHTTEIRVFRMDDCTWYAGSSVQDCAKQFSIDTGYADTEEGFKEFQRDCFSFNEAYKVTPDDMNRLTFRLEDGGSCSFLENLEEMKTEGQKFPTFFASTEW